MIRDWVHGVKKGLAGCLVAASALALAGSLSACSPMTVTCGFCQSNSIPYDGYMCPSCYARDYGIKKFLASADLTYDDVLFNMNDEAIVDYLQDSDYTVFAWGDEEEAASWLEGLDYMVFEDHKSMMRELSDAGYLAFETDAEAIAYLRDRGYVVFGD